MKLPTLEQAASAIAMLSGAGPAVTAAAGLVNVVIDLFDDDKDQATLKDEYVKAKAATDAALDNLDAAIDEAEGKSAS